MKKTTLFLISFMLCLAVNSQDMGVIEVNEQYTATLKFNEEINFIVTGNNPQIDENEFMYYNIFQAGTTCIIRGNDKNAEPTSITIKLMNDDVWYGILRYGDDKKIFYDFSAEQQKKEMLEEKKEQQKEDALNQTMQSRLFQLMAERPQYSTLGKIENGLQYQISNIRNDDKYTYVKIIIENKTGSDYNIDGIFFKYTEGRRRGLKKKEAQIEERIFAVYESPKNLVRAYEIEEFGFVIPLFSVGEKGNLSIQIREKSGTRNPEIIIPGNEMLKVRIF